MVHLNAGHVSWFGNEQQNYLDICQKTFASKQTLKKDKQKIREVNLTTQESMTCSEYEECFKTRREIHIRIENSHKTAVKIQKIYIE